ncbi:hypothetical protein [Nonomuraea sp. KM90]|uniref:hypothetical protein n=1 Tax=Nonomuraea sp. KM90 TaxID=3457428 RepID=UPI003FCCE4A4
MATIVTIDRLDRQILNLMRERAQAYADATGRLGMETHELKQLGISASPPLPRGRPRAARAGRAGGPSAAGRSGGEAEPGAPADQAAEASAIAAADFMSR